MTMTLASIVVAIYVIYLIITNIHRAETLLIRLFVVNLVYEGFINVGYFIRISSQTFKVADFLQFICVFLSLLILIKKGFLKGLLAYIAIVGLSIVMLLTNPLQELVRTFNGIDFVNNIKYQHYPAFDLQTIKTSVRLVCFAINASAVTACMTRERWLSILDIYLKAGRLIIGYAWIEFVLKNIVQISITEDLIRLVFGSDTSIMTSLERNGLFVIIGLNNEPSQFCMMLYSFFLVYLMSKGYLRQTKRQNRLTISGVVLMLLCGSFRAMGLLPILLIIYMIQSKASTRSLLTVCGVFAVITILYAGGALDYYFERLGRAFQFLKTQDATIAGGEAGRLNTIVEAFQVFLKRPLLGIGPGQTFAYGFVPSMLAMTGLLGIASWYRLMFGDIGKIGTSVDKRRWMLIALVISVSWIYTDSIAIGYSIYVIPMMMSIRYEVFRTALPEQRNIVRKECIYG